MDVLILGGTGAMGVHLIEELEKEGHHITVTSRKAHNSRKNVRYIKGNAQEEAFFEELCKMKHWDSIVDFLVSSSEKLENRIKKFLSATDQYVFISSARVYADKPDEPITEDADRLLDVCEDKEYLATDEYALAKAREEDIIFKQEQKNWTIIRPSLTYGENRMQLGVYEKENWLYRALKGRAIVFSKDLMGRSYTLSYGRDVAKGIAAIVGKQNATGEIFHIMADKSYKWKEILEIYVSELERSTGIKPNVILTDKCSNLEIPDTRYQVIYGRYFNRNFDNSKINAFTDTKNWLDAKDGLRICLEKFLKNPQFKDINWKIEAVIDRKVKERTPLKEIKGWKNKIIYVCYRYKMESVIRTIKRLSNCQGSCQ